MSFSLTVKSPAEVAAAARAETERQINQERTRRLVAGITVDIAGVGGVRLEGDPTTIQNTESLAFAASMRVGQGDVLTITPYRDADNDVHNMTPPQVIELWSRASTYVSELYIAAWTLKDAATIPVDWDDDTHWPDPALF